MELGAERDELLAACRRLAAAGLVPGTSGNASRRCGDLVLVTPAGAALATVTADELVVVGPDGAAVDDGPATSELPLHLLLYRATSASAVVHAHALASTAVACVLDALPPVHYMTMALGGTVRVAPYATFGTDALARHVLGALDGRVAALMQNHGSVAYGAALAEACERLELLEWLCELYARAVQLGDPRVLDDDELAAALAAGADRWGEVGH